MKREKEYLAAIYIRLSKEDGDGEKESNSVKSQRDILTEYVNSAKGISIFDYYIDDGYSGTRFDRPAFNRMIEDIRLGKVNCVIVKDLSRFGRNYIDAGNYIDLLFPQWNVRFIAVNNGLDFYGGGDRDTSSYLTAGVYNVVNESYAAGTSSSVKSSLNLARRQGKFIGSFASYGYKKSQSDRHKLIVDKEAADTVREIFNLFLAGKSIIGIAKHLNDLAIPCPAQYKKANNPTYKSPTGKFGDGLWHDSTVRRILQNRMYTGDMVQGKTKKISYKLNKTLAVDREDWLIVENTHEAIIDKDTFEAAQALFKKGGRAQGTKKEVDLFSGLVRCGGCGRSMCKKTNIHPYATYHYYRCSTARKMSKVKCTNHTIRIDKLEEAVFETLRRLIEVAVDFDEAIAKIKSSPERKNQSKKLKASMAKAQKKQNELAHAKKALHLSLAKGLISDEEYLELKQDYQNGIDRLERRIEDMKKAASVFEKDAEENDFITHFKKYKSIERLTRGVVVELIDSIVIHGGDNIEINMNFADAFEYAKEYVDIHTKSA